MLKTAMKDFGTIVLVLIGLGVMIWMWLIPFAKEMWAYAVQPTRLMTDLLEWGIWVVGGFIVCVILGLLVMAHDRWRARPKKQARS